MNKLDQIILAKKLGRAGFYTGKQAPAQDAKVLNMLKGRQIGDQHGVDLLDAWNNGWNAARESTDEYKQAMAYVFGDE